MCGRIVCSFFVLSRVIPSDLINVVGYWTLIMIISQARLDKPSKYSRVVASSKATVQKLPNVICSETLIDQAHKIIHNGPKRPDIAMRTKFCPWVGSVEYG